MRRRLFATTAAIAFTLLAFPAHIRATGPSLAINGNVFEIDTRPKFLLLVSYFDGMDAGANLDSDLAQLQAWGVDGIRVFAMWHDSGSVLYTNGTVDNDGLDKLKDVLDAAAYYGMVVDVSFDYHIQPIDSLEAYLSGLEAVASQLSGYDNIMFDVQNEARESHGEDPSDVHDMIDAVHSGDSNRIAFASVDQGVQGADVATWAANTYSQVAASHQERVPDWWSGTATWVDDIASNTSKPVYMQEPWRRSQAEWSVQDMRDALTAAELNGAAGWVLHSDAGDDRDLASNDFIDNLDSAELEFLSTYRCTGSCSVNLKMGIYYVREAQAGGGNWDLTDATATSVSSTDTFALNDLTSNGGLFDGDEVSLFTSHSRYLGAQDGGGSGKLLLTTATSVGSWETFVIENVTKGSGRLITQGDEVAIRRDTHYVSAANGGGDFVYVDPTSRGSYETFRFIFEN